MEDTRITFKTAKLAKENENFMKKIDADKFPNWKSVLEYLMFKI